MNQFATCRDAKEFLVARILDEAQREGVPLSDVERKMLYFTESGWTLPDISSVSAQFDNEYDQNQYENKIAGLIRNAAKHDRKESRDEYDAWWSAIRFLKKEDHYLLVMVGIVIRKIISSTSMMSTIGVTLISDARWSLPPCIPMTKTPSPGKRNTESVRDAPPYRSRRSPDYGFSCLVRFLMK